MPPRIKRRTPEEIRRNYFLGAAGISVVALVVSLARGELGDALFSGAIALLSSLGEGIVAPKEIVEGIRRWFQVYGDSAARQLLIATAVGGTALAIDISYDLSFLPDYLDIVVKRLSPALIIITCACYFSALLSKRVYGISQFEADQATRRLEFRYYCSVVLLCFTVTVLAVGSPIDRVLPSSWSKYHPSDEETDSTKNEHSETKQKRPELPTWSLESLRLQATLVAISAVWVVCFYFCLLSRYLEFTRRDLVDREHHA